MRLSISIIVLLFISCNSLKNKSPSFWETQKNNFKYQNKKEFVSDSILRADFKANSFWKIRHPMFDSIIGTPGYLYSWQDRDTTKNEFTPPALVSVKDERPWGVSPHTTYAQHNLLSPATPLPA